MDWIVVAALILFGLALIIVELIFIPGTTIVGLLGLGFAGVGIYFSYEYYGNATGTGVLVGVLVVFVVALVYSFKAGIWQRFALKQTNEAKFNEHKLANLKVGDEGITLSSLRPMGKAEFGEQEYEVTTLGHYMEANQKVVITSLTNTKVIVEPLNT